ncbi:MAG: Holliday junction branch migration protein RuvA [Firmicutes bacterium]|nr:Holliday junction branch migration protein RuvA [Bacillota bacterium]
MIAYIQGSLEYIGNGFIIVETGGVGFRVFVSPAVVSLLPEIKNEVKIYTYMSVKEDGISLFGFTKMEEIELFNKLITVNGIGPKAAIGILGTMSVEDVIMAIASEDVASLTKVPGLGKKTAQRIIIDLKDKFKNEDFLRSINVSESGTVKEGCMAEAAEALMALGYSRSEAAKAISAVQKEGMNAEMLIKASLKYFIKK